MRRPALAVLALAFLAACQPNVAPLTEEDMAALKALTAAGVEATLAGDCDAGMYAENAVVMPQDEPIIEGRAAIRASCEADEEPYSLDFNFTVTSLEIDGYGDLAYDRGIWSWTSAAADTAEAVRVTGKYLTIARKQADGSWLWTVDIWNSDEPLPQPEQQPEQP